MPFKKGHKMNIGRKVSQETREKLRIAGKRPNSGQFKKGIKNTSGNPWTPEIRKRFSRIMKEKFKKYPVWNKGKKCPQLSGEKHWNWKGGKIKTKFGYIRFHQPEHPHSDRQGYIFEHIIMMEKHIGRYLNSDEIVHHINGIKDDNRIENLKLMTDRVHRSFHSRLSVKNGTHNFLEKGHIPWNKGKKLPQYSGKNHWTYKKINH
jgi:hypothetical protein